jgi:sulfide:quinone oxidoreductase
MKSPPLRSFGGAPARVVIAGGGVAALELVLALRALAKERVVIDLIAPGEDFVYRPLSVLEPFGLGQTPRLKLQKIAAAQGFHYHRDGIAEVDADRGRARTRSSNELRYDALVVATGAKPLEAVPGALTFSGQAGIEGVGRVLEEVRRGEAKRVVFIVPAGPVWALPLYELALHSAAHLASREAEDVELVVATSEDAPLGIFGRRVSDAVRALLHGRGIQLRVSTLAVAADAGGVTLLSQKYIRADRVVALPRLEGRSVAGLPRDERGFIPTDENGSVEGVSNVYAAGDVTTFPVKQGGIAAEQADLIAETIAARAGAPVEPVPFRPVLRGMLLTGSGPRYLSAEITRGPAVDSTAAVDPLWWPVSKIAGRYLASFLAEQANAEPLLARSQAVDGTVPFEINMEALAF